MLLKLVFVVLLSAQHVLLNPVEPGFTNLEVGLFPIDIDTVTGSIDDHLEGSQNITRVFFRESVDHLHRGCIKNLPELSSITSIDKSIKSISSHAFENLPKIETITIVEGKLTSIPKHVFPHLPVQELSFQDNEINQIEEGAFEHLPKLKTLNLEGNKLSAWNPNWIGSTSPKLKTIDLTSNSIKVIQAEAFKFFENLEEIVLAKNEICSVNPKAFERNILLRTLDLTENKLSSWSPDTIIGSGDVEDIVLRLRLYNNHIKALPEKFVKSLKTAVVFLVDNPVSCTCESEMQNWGKSKAVEVIADGCTDTTTSCADEVITQQC